MAVPSKRLVDDRDDDRDDRDDRPANRKPKKKSDGALAVGILIGGFAILVIGGSIVLVGVYIAGMRQTSDPIASGLPVPLPGANNQGAFIPGDGNPPVFDPPAGPVPTDPPRSDPPRNDPAPSDPGPPPAAPRAADPPKGTNPLVAESKPTDSKPVIVPPSGKLAKTLTNDPPPIAPNGVLPQDILAKVKRATVFVRVTDFRGRTGSGSGFFGSTVKDTVLTNAHVVGMLDLDAQFPKKVEVILNSGEKDEVLFSGVVLAADRSADLAVIKIAPIAGQKKIDLPEPLTIGANYRLQETQKLYVVGFPFGYDIGKNITVADTSISSLRKTPEGELEQIQVKGGMEHGNSGGPVVDAAGNLIGVAVAGISGTSINFAIPSERVNSILDGRLAGIAIGDPVMRGTNYNVTVEVDTLDPMRKIKGLTLDWWWGSSTDKVPPARGAAPAHPDEATPRQTVAMKSKEANRYAADLSFPSNIPANKVLWLQPHYDNASDQALFVQGMTKEIEAPPEPKNAVIAFRPTGGETTVTLKSTNRFTYRTPDGESHSLLFNIESPMAERTAQPGGGHIGSTLGFKKFDVDILVDDKPMRGRTEEISRAVQHIGKMAIHLQTDRLGNVVDTNIGLDGVPPEVQPMLNRFAAQIGQSMDFASITFPNTEVRPGQFWRGQRQIPIPSPDEDITTLVPVTYTYQGVRKVNDCDLAVVAMTGRLGGTRNQTLNLSGTVNGTAQIDVLLGRIAKVNVTVDSTMNLNFRMDDGRAQSVQARSRLEVRMSRQ